MSLHLAGSKQLLLGKVSDAFVAARNASVADVEFVAIVWESICYAMSSNVLVGLIC